MSIPPAPGRWPAWLPLTIIVSAALCVRLALAPAYAYLPDDYLDERFWTSWMFAIHDRGVLNVFRTTEANYVGYQWVLWLLSIAYDGIGGAYGLGDTKLHLLVKAPSIVADLALIVVVYHATAALAGATGGTSQGRSIGRRERLALAAAAVIAFQPAVLYDSAVWAQTDAAISVAMLGALLLMARGKPTAAWAVWALGFAIKPQPVMILPVMAFFTLHNYGVRALARGGGAAFATVGIGVLPWLLHGDTLRITQAYGRLMSSDYGRLSVSAWNTWWFGDRLLAAKPEDAVFGALPFVTYRLLGLSLAMLAAALAAGYTSLHRDLRGLLTAGAYMAFAFFMLPMSIHERYLFPVLVLLLPVAVTDRRWMWIYAPASATLFLNMFVVAPPVHAWSGRWVEAPIIPFVATANVVLFGAFSAVLARDAVRAAPAALGFVRNSYPFSRIGRPAIAAAERRLDEAA